MSPSITNKNKKCDRGSPWCKPISNLNSFIRLSLTNAEVEVIWFYVLCRLKSSKNCDDENWTRKSYITSIISQESSTKKSIQVHLWRAKKSQINQTKGNEDVKARIIMSLVFLSCIW